MLALTHISPLPRVSANLVIALEEKHPCWLIISDAMVLLLVQYSIIVRTEETVGQKKKKGVKKWKGSTTEERGRTG